jgi:hypothetical protein
MINQSQPPSSDILNFLRSKEGQRFRSWQVADKFQMRTKETTPILTRLEQMGLITSCIIGNNRFFYVQSEAQKAMVSSAFTPRPFRPLRYYDAMLRQSFLRR